MVKITVPVSVKNPPKITKRGHLSTFRLISILR